MTLRYTRAGLAWRRNAIRLVGRKRRSGGNRRRGAKRARYGSRSSTLSQRRAQPEVGSYQQFTNESRSFGRRLTGNRLRASLVRAATQPIIFSYKGVKNFDNNGYYLMANCANEIDRSLPVMCCLLNGNPLQGPSFCPLKQLWCKTGGASDGNFYWVDCPGIDPQLQVGTKTTMSVEHADGMNLTEDMNIARMHWKWSEIKLNLWGAKSKAVKWVVQIVRVTEDNMSPWHIPASTALGDEAQQNWEETVKQFTYNPITKLNYEKAKKIKVLKTWERVIQPTSTTENDADPHVHTLKWFSRWDKNVSFNRVNLAQYDGLVNISDDAELVGQMEKTQLGQQSYSGLPYEKSQIFLFIRASDYVNKAFEAGTNDLCGSFDLSIRSKWNMLQ